MSRNELMKEFICWFYFFHRRFSLVSISIVISQHDIINRISFPPVKVFFHLSLSPLVYHDPACYPQSIDSIVFKFVFDSTSR